MMNLNRFVPFVAPSSPPSDFDGELCQSLDSGEGESEEVAEPGTVGMLAEP
jgi:hypothetical protein